MTRYSITDLGVAPGFGASRANALNDRGQVIGSLTKSVEGYDLPSASFLWEDGRTRVVDRVILRALNNNGQAVGDGHHDTTLAVGTPVLFENGHVRKLFANARTGYAKAINDQGQIVGWAQGVSKKSRSQTIKRGGFVWENGRRRWLHAPPGFRPSEAVAINNTGHIVGNVTEANPVDLHGIVWDGDEMTLMDVPPGFTQSHAISVNDRRQVLARAVFWEQKVIDEMIERTVAGQSAEDIAHSCPYDQEVMRQKSFLWENGQIQVFNGLANAVNNHGQVVGWSGCDLSHIETVCHQPFAFVRQNGDLSDLNSLIDAADWLLIQATDINNRGEIVGYGRHEGQPRAFLLTPREPS